MPVESSFPPVDIPTTDLWNFLFVRKDRPWPDNKVIYRDANSPRHYTHAQVQDTALEFGKGLKALWNWKKGDVLNLFTPNCIDTPSVTWGTHWAGGIISPANPGYTADELAYQLKDSGARAIATQVPMLPVAKAACKKAGVPEDMICLVGDQRDPEGRIKHFTSMRNISRSIRYHKTKLDAKKDLAFLVYSSGTTGVPKGVRLSHYNIVANVLQCVVGEGRKLTWQGVDGTGDRILAVLPFFHIYGLTCLIHNAMYNGLECVVMSKFEIEQFCSLIQKHKVTFSYVVPPIVLLLGKHPAVTKYDLSSLRMLNSGAAPLTRELVDAVYKRLNVKVKQGYGLSETSPTSHTQPWEEWYSSIGSVGRMLPNMTARYMTSPEDGSEPKEVPTGQVGELYMKGPNVFQGYHNKPRETAECLSTDGWLRTGDVGYQDKDGNFFITDRVKELIKYKGFQVPPAELEGYLVDHELVDDVAVVGVQSEVLGTEVPRAYVVRAGGSKAKQPGDEEKIISWLATKVSNHKKLRGGVKFVDEIPKSASGKILRRLLKNQAKNGFAKEDAPQVKAKL